MRTYQSRMLLAKEIPESVSNEAASPPVVEQVTVPDERVLREKEGEESTNETAVTSPPLPSPLADLPSGS